MHCERPYQHIIIFATTKRLEIDFKEPVKYMPRWARAWQPHHFELTGHSLRTLWSFTGGSDGGSPSSGLIADRRGALYGTTGGGGAGGNGTVFKIDPFDGTLTTIWSFSGSDGAVPGGNLLVDEEGALYGATGSGGVPNPSVCYFGVGCGTIFKLTPPAHGQTLWTLTTLWSFSGGVDGGAPNGGLIADGHGALYGTTQLGGLGPGVVFKLTPPEDGESSWTESTLWSFSGGNDGGDPIGPVVMDRAGVLYGTAGGGAINLSGTVFKLTPPRHGETAWSLTTLWSFTGGSDGGNSYAGLVADKWGVLYGTTAFGGDITSPICGDFGCGVVFKLTGTGYVPYAMGCEPIKSVECTANLPRPACGERSEAARSTASG